MTLKDFEDYITNIFLQKEPNIIISHIPNKVFAVQINKSITTGKGGLELYLKTGPIIGVNYNGIDFKGEEMIELLKNLGIEV